MAARGRVQERVSTEIGFLAMTQIGSVRDDVKTEVIICNRCKTVQPADVWWDRHPIMKPLRMTDCVSCGERIYYDDWNALKTVFTMDVSVQIARFGDEYYAFWNGVGGKGYHVLTALWRAMKNKWKSGYGGR